MWYEMAEAWDDIVHENTTTPNTSTTECDTDLDSRREMNFLKSILTTFVASFVS